MSFLEKVKAYLGLKKNWYSIIEDDGSSIIHYWAYPVQNLKFYKFLKKVKNRYLPRFFYNKTRKAVPRTAEEMLRNIRTFLAYSKYEEGDKLWKIMSAFRGPDSEDYDLKSATTSIIRNKALEDVASRFGLSSGKDSDEKKEIRSTISTRRFLHGKDGNHRPSSHFEYHSRKAFKLLGLDWGDSNEV